MDLIQVYYESVSSKKNKSFEKEVEGFFLKLKKMGRDERNILKNKVKAKEKNNLINLT